VIGSVGKGAGLVIAFAACLVLPAASQAQRGGRGGAENPAAEPEQPLGDQSDFAAWNQEKDPEKKIKLGQDFVQKYPKSRFTQGVYNQLVTAYFVRQDWNNVYATADQTLAKFPDDVQVLTQVSWIIPRLYDKDDPAAEAKLVKAKTYAKHALEVIPTVPKPGRVTDDQFAASQKAESSLAHSALGLVYFRTTKYEDSVKELQQATQAATNPNAIDYFALGFGLEQLHRFSEAADAYRQCSQVPGNLQAPCRDSADQAASHAAPAK
jgi:tetratricopeptide (TPR) repeat protein